ncbi:MAG: PIN domain-containing protein [Sulfuritalea sp.]|nr:PIN domain-containing protein [Sulfuritalea sp.]
MPRASTSDHWIWPGLAKWVGIYGAWVAVPTDTSHVLRAVDIMKGYSLSFWDSMIVALAEATQCRILLSEDIQHGQTIAGVRVEKSFPDHLTQR